MTQTDRSALYVASLAALAAGVVACVVRGLALKPKHPTHKIVCECACLGETSGVPLPWNEKETHDVPVSGSCADLNDIECADGAGKLGRCKKISVPVRAVLVRSDELVIWR